MNDRIPPQVCSMCYISLDDAVCILRDCRKGTLVAKANIESVFQLLPVHPDDFVLLGFQFESSVFFDWVLLMRCSVSCAAFEKFSIFLEFSIWVRAGLTSSAHYLDNFLLIGQVGTDQCMFMLQSLDICQEFGVPFAHDKTEDPS